MSRKAPKPKAAPKRAAKRKPAPKRAKAPESAPAEAAAAPPVLAGEVVIRPVDSIKPYIRNTKHHPQAQIQRLADNMREFGWTEPLIIRPDGELLAGHGRMQAAGLLDLKEVPCIIIEHLSDEQARAYRIADNRHGELGKWDRDKVREEFGKLIAAEYDLTLLGFNERHFKDLLDQEEKPLPTEDDLPDLPEKAVTEAGDLWLLNDHRLACGDSTDAAVAAAALGPHRPHLLVTDPPYGVNYDPNWYLRVRKAKTAKAAVSNDHLANWEGAWEHFPGGVAYIWHSDLHADHVAASIEAAKFRIQEEIIWKKEISILSRGHYHWQHELCIYARKPNFAAHWQPRGTQGTIWRISKQGRDADTVHGTQKPVECMRRPIRHSSEAGDSVYDPFLGSGTTLIAAELTGRIACTCELDPAYCDISIRRWQAISGGEARLEATGQTFAEVEAERLGKAGSKGLKARRRKPAAKRAGKAAAKPLAKAAAKPRRRKGASAKA